MVYVAPGMALAPLQKFHIDFPMEVPFAKGKWPCPLKGEIPGLLLVFYKLGLCTMYIVVYAYFALET